MLFKGFWPFKESKSVIFAAVWCGEPRLSLMGGPGRQRRGETGPKTSRKVQEGRPVKHRDEGVGITLFNRNGAPVDGPWKGRAQRKEVPGFPRGPDARPLFRREQRENPWNSNAAGGGGTSSALFQWPAPKRTFGPGWFWSRAGRGPWSQVAGGGGRVEAGLCCC